MTILKTAVLVPTSKEKASAWRYTIEKPADGWFKPDFDDEQWKEGPGGFGTKGTPGAVVAHRMEDRRHLAAARVHLAGGQVRRLATAAAPRRRRGGLRQRRAGREAARATTAITRRCRSAREAKAALKPGKNVLAVHCHQKTGGQYIDVGIVDVKEEKAVGPKPGEKKAAALPTAAPAGLRAVPFQDVQVRDDFWSPRIQTNRKVHRRGQPVASAKSPAASRTSPSPASSKRASTRASLYNDSDVYKVIEGIAYSLADQRDPDLEKRTDAIIDQIAAAQQPDGYLEHLLHARRAEEALEEHPVRP